MKIMFKKKKIVLLSRPEFKQQEIRHGETLAIETDKICRYSHTKITQ